MRRFRSEPKEALDHARPTAPRSGRGSDAPSSLVRNAAEEMESAVTAPDDVGAGDMHESGPTRHQIEGISRQLSVLHDFVEERLRYDEEREGHFARLYEELDRYKRNEASERMLTLARGLIELIDRLEPLDQFQHVVEEIEESLKTVGVERLHTPHQLAKAGEQVVIGFLPPDSPQEIEVLTDGWSFESRTIRPRRVVIRKDDALEDPR